MVNSFGRLQIVRQTDSGEMQSYVVFDPERGREILLHVLPAEHTTNNRPLWERLDRGLKTAPEVFLERGNLLGVQYVVTEFNKECETLFSLLERSSGQSEAAVDAEPGEFTRAFKGPSKPSGEVPSKDPATGEFTRLFRPDQVRSAPAQAYSEGDGPIAEGVAGDFTSVFQESSSPDEALACPVPKPQAPNVAVDPDKTRLFNFRAPSAPANASPEKIRDPRGFSDLFQTPPTPVTNPIPFKQEPPSDAVAKQDFNKYFQEPLGKGSGEINFDKKVPNPAQRTKEPGEFTQMFGHPFSSDHRQPPTPRPLDPAGATGVFSPNEFKTLPFANQRAGESEYTKVIKSSGERPAPSDELSQWQPAPPPATSALTGLVFAVLGVLMMLAIALVLYFGLKH